MSRDLSFLEFKEGDGYELHAMKAEWQMLMRMPPPERRALLQEWAIEYGKRYLRRMITSNKDDDGSIQYATSKAKQAMADYNISHDESLLDKAEMWAEVAKGTRGSKYTIGEIRKQRENIQWMVKQRNQMSKSSDEQSQSSNPSTT